MAKNELIYSFDLGSGSIGVCVRSGKNILHLDSLLIDADFASVKDAATRRRQIRTRIAHKERERWWDEQAKKAGIEVLSTTQPTKENTKLKPDNRMLVEFLPEESKDKTIYSSHLLRIALLQGVKLEGWQVYKAIRSAMQRRGYDAKLPWAADAGKIDKDEKVNSENSNRYDEKLKEFFSNKTEYYYPCYYEAYIQGIWDPKKPDNFSKRLSENPAPARNKENKPAEDKAFPSRQLVEKELKALLENAAKLFPKLRGKEDFIIYGPAQKAYASFDKDDKYTQYRGTNWDWQGLLGQKVPRFDNRIIAKCRLIPRLNVCTAKKQINKEVSFLLNLKNMRYSTESATSAALSSKQINEIFEIYIKYANIEKEKAADSSNTIKIKPKDNPFTKTFWKEYVKNLGGSTNPGQQEIAKPKEGGRSSFCKPALHILHGLILSGKNPQDYHKELVAANKNTDTNKGLVKEDYRFLLNMPNDWHSISIQDAREEDKKMSRKEAQLKIEKIISGISNRIVRHRLTMLVRQLEKLNDKFTKEYGLPDKVIFEIAREDFMGAKKKEEYQNFQNANKKENDDAVKKLQELGLRASAANILKIRLGNQQKWEDVYDTGEHRNLTAQNIGQYEIDHIVPQGAKGGSDSFSNFVLTKNKFNQNKGGFTPYEWFSQKRAGDWEDYVKNVRKIYGDDKKNEKKVDLLISDKACESEKRKTDLQATSYLEKLSQSIAGLYFGFGVNTKGDERKIRFYTGGETAIVRSKLDLNELLYASKEEFEKAKHSNEGLAKKNRNNKKHHALDALVLSMLPEIKISKREIEEKPAYFNKEYVKKEIANVIPETIKKITPKLRETIYALRCRMEDGKKCYYFVSHFDSSINNFKLLEGKKANDKCATKNADKIFDLKIKKDFQEKLNEKGLTQEKWEKFLNTYADNGKRIKKLAVIDSKAFSEKEVFNEDGSFKEVIGEYGNKGAIAGQWIKGKEGHQGQVVYKDEKGKWKVEPVYVFESVYNKRKLFENRYEHVHFFQSGQLVKIKKDYQEMQSGIYKLRTITAAGQCKIESIVDQKEYLKNIGMFIEQCGMEAYKKQ